MRLRRRALLGARTFRLDCLRRRLAQARRALRRQLWWDRPVRAGRAGRRRGPTPRPRAPLAHPRCTWSTPPSLARIVHGSLA